MLARSLVGATRRCHRGNRIHAAIGFQLKRNPVGKRGQSLHLAHVGMVVRKRGINAVNYCIADTTLCDEEYAEFVSESVNLDLLEVTSN
jgi:hypothetical protein